MNEQVTVVPTSRRSAVCSDILLRETQTSRLLFRPMLVDNPQEPEAAVKGGFIYQRKNSKGRWEDTSGIDLSSLKGGEGVKIPLKSHEVYQLFSSLRDLYQVFDSSGIPTATAKFLKLSGPLAQIADFEESELRDYLNAYTRVGSTLLSRLLQWATESDDPEGLATALAGLRVDAVERLGSAVQLQRLRAALHLWSVHRNRGDEEFWQHTLKSYMFVLSQVFAYPIILLKDKAYVGGKGIENSGGGVVDFLCANSVTTNVALAEIKTPSTPLLRGEYRSGLPNISPEVTGSVIQVLAYRDELTKNYSQLAAGSSLDFDVFQPQCLVVIGDAERQLKSSDQRRTFELFRGSLVGVQVLTYDELFAKVEALINAITT